MLNSCKCVRSLLQVEEISLTSIVVRRTDGVRQWYPIAKMSTNTLSNLTRSDNKSDKLAVCPQLSLHCLMQPLVTTSKCLQRPGLAPAELNPLYHPLLTVPATAFVCFVSACG